MTSPKPCGPRMRCIAGALFRRNASMRARPVRIGVILLLAILSGLTSATATGGEVEVPYIGEPADRILPPHEERKIGRNIVYQLLLHGLVLEDPELSDYINRIGQDLASHIPGAPELSFFVIRDTGINAFALPGGYIGINAGLITASESESELAGVIAHEIAHVTQRHIARQIDATRGWNLAGIGLLLAAILAGGDADVVQAALGLGLSISHQRQVNFTRSHELEADRLGIRTLAKAGYDPIGMASFFQRLEQNARLYGEGVPEILRTHPVNSTRISEAQARAASYPIAQPRLNLNYQVIQARTRTLSSALNSDAIEYFRSTSANSQSPADQYGLALTLSRAGQYADAQPLYDALLVAHPEDVHFRLAQARNRALAGDREQSVKQLKDIRRDHPEHAAVTLALAEALINAGRAADARQLLLETDLLAQRHGESYRLLAVAARDMGQLPEAHFQMAAYERSRGNYVAALGQLRSGLSLSPLSDHQRQRITARLAEYTDEAPREQLRAYNEKGQERRREHGS